LSQLPGCVSIVEAGRGFYVRKMHQVEEHS
jgi:hypothetical protein